MHTKNVYKRERLGNIHLVFFNAKITKLIAVVLGLIILFPSQARAEEINFDLLREWEIQPTNVQYSLAYNGTTIDVVDSLPQTYLSETWGITNTYVYPNTKYVLATEIELLRGHEDCLTHEVGHAVSHYNRVAFFWVENQYWTNIYLTESHNQMIYPQGWDNAYEYFACCYDEYLRFPKYMKALQPASYNYMKVVMDYTN